MNKILRARFKPSPDETWACLEDNVKIMRLRAAYDIQTAGGASELIHLITSRNHTVCNNTLYVHTACGRPLRRYEQGNTNMVFYHNLATCAVCMAHGSDTDLDSFNEWLVANGLTAHLKNLK